MRKLLGMRAIGLVEENLGATERTLKLLKRFAVIT
jgi:hypothetical protein